MFAVIRLQLNLFLRSLNNGEPIQSCWYFFFFSLSFVNDVNFGLSILKSSAHIIYIYIYMRFDARHNNITFNSVFNGRYCECDRRHCKTFSIFLIARNTLELIILTFSLSYIQSTQKILNVFLLG